MAFLSFFFLFYFLYMWYHRDHGAWRITFHLWSPSTSIFKPWTTIMRIGIKVNGSRFHMQSKKSGCTYCIDVSGWDVLDRFVSVHFCNAVDYYCWRNCGTRGIGRIVWATTHNKAVIQYSKFDHVYIGQSWNIIQKKSTWDALIFCLWLLSMNQFLLRLHFDLSSQ